MQYPDAPKVALGFSQGSNVLVQVSALHMTYLLACSVMSYVLTG